jgi:hypothetical protein
MPPCATPMRRLNAYDRQFTQRTEKNVWQYESFMSAVADGVASPKGALNRQKWLTMANVAQRCKQQRPSLKSSQSLRGKRQHVQGLVLIQTCSLTLTRSDYRARVVRIVKNNWNMRNSTKRYVGLHTSSWIADISSTLLMSGTYTYCGPARSSAIQRCYRPQCVRTRLQQCPTTA